MYKSANQVSEKLLMAVKMNTSTEELIDELATMRLDMLKNNLQTDLYKKAFWINIYNAFFQILRKVEKVDKSEIYTVKKIKVAGEEFSLDDVEHGILRKYRAKFSLGYLPNLFFRKIVKDLAVDKIDYRIHFALNCGAASCPPIAFYSPDRLGIQLEIATASFLEGETDVLEDTKEIHTTRLFRWFLGDFGGKRGIEKILSDKLNVTATDYKLVYKDYSWEEQLDNYA